MPIAFPTMAERPDLRQRARALMDMWPPFMHHDPVANAYFGRVRDEHDQLQFFAWDARLHGFTVLVAPVRPSLKHRYPLADIERYVGWRRQDGSHLDPWLRTHERFGGEILKVAPRSMVIPGTVAEWRGWTEMEFPETGAYVVPGALVPVEIDVEDDHGLYVEPNVWMRHRL